MPAPGHLSRGAILFMPGRGDYYEKYLETLWQWSQRGWHVTALDWRGQSGSGRMGNDAVTGHVADFSVWIGDLAAFWHQWSAERSGPHILAAHSMGGHICMRALAEHLIMPDAVVLSAPMLGFATKYLPLPIMHAIARIIARFGDRRRPAWKWSEKPGEVPAGRELLLTHDDDRYADELWWRGHRPELVMGPGSWGWVERGYASTRIMNRHGYFEGVQVPVLILAPAHDGLVDYKASRRIAARLPRGELVTLGPEARHEILRETDAVRDRVMAAIDSFLDRVAPPPQLAPEISRD